MVIGMMPARCSPMVTKAGMLMSMCVASHSGHRFVTYTRILPPATRSRKDQLLRAIRTERGPAATCFRIGNTSNQLILILRAFTEQRSPAVSHLAHKYVFLDQRRNKSQDMRDQPVTFRSFKEWGTVKLHAMEVRHFCLAESRRYVTIAHLCSQALAVAALSRSPSRSRRPHQSRGRIPPGC
jgi:hypothetical protein